MLGAGGGGDGRGVRRAGSGARARAAQSCGDAERTRTHMMFRAKGAKVQKRRTRRTTNKLHLTPHRHDATVQVGAADADELDPAEWAGNQRVLHYGPWAQRDHFFYYYPKSWDILYPAQFGFFPYRARDFRGSSPRICLSAFGVFFLLGGAAMVYLGFFRLFDRGFWEDGFDLSAGVPPLQVAGPICLALGIVFFVLGVCWWCCGLQLCTEALRHTQAHHGPPRRTVTTHTAYEAPVNSDLVGKSPYLPPPPPVYPVLANAYASPRLWSPESEAKLYPPVQGSQSVLSLQSSAAAVGAYRSASSAALRGGSSRRSSSAATAPASLTTVNASALAALESAAQWPEYHRSGSASVSQPPPRSQRRRRPTAAVIRPRHLSLPGGDD